MRQELRNSAEPTALERLATMATRTHTLTLTLAPALASVTGVADLTIRYDSSRADADPRDGNARNSAMRSLCAMLCQSEAGRSLIQSAQEGDSKAGTILAMAFPQAWKDQGKAMEALALAYKGEREWPIAIPRPAPYASRALSAWQHAEDKRQAQAAKEAKATESAKAETPAPAESDKPETAKPAKGKASKRKGGKGKPEGDKA